MRTNLRRYSAHQTAYPAEEVFNKQKERMPLQWMSLSLTSAIPNVFTIVHGHHSYGIIVMVSGMNAIHGSNSMIYHHLQLLNMQPVSSRDGH